MYKIITPWGEHEFSYEEMVNLCNILICMEGADDEHEKSMREKIKKVKKEVPATSY